VVLVASKGDDALRALGERPTLHFPGSEDGQYLGYHPPNDEWAIDELERMRRRGAGFLLLPAVTLWWLDHYGQFAEYLKGRYPVVVDDRDRCVIFDLQESLMSPRPEPRAGTAR
jgi:hypothetical protein